jgi:hypothetical protein
MITHKELLTKKDYRELSLIDLERLVSSNLSKEDWNVLKGDTSKEKAKILWSKWHYQDGRLKPTRNLTVIRLEKSNSELKEKVKEQSGFYTLLKKEKDLLDEITMNQKTRIEDLEIENKHFKSVLKIKMDTISNLENLISLKQADISILNRQTKDLNIRVSSFKNWTIRYFLSGAVIGFILSIIINFLTK